MKLRNNLSLVRGDASLSASGRRQPTNALTLRSKFISDGLIFFLDFLKKVHCRQIRLNKVEINNKLEILQNFLNLFKIKLGYSH